MAALKILLGRTTIIVAKFLISTGAFIAALGIAFGAFGAHGLRAKLEPRMLEVWQTGVEYHMYHALGLILIGMISHWLGSSALIKWSGGLMLAGILLFSGSLYVLALTGAGWLGAIAPLGGSSFIIAWILLAVALLRTS
ncbi:Protein of unknown function DUF423 [Nitrosococcus oceani ATCC 19707]|uniref:DUF423 domain-containing protein n=1 Tax=Nitrosococcus oceani (strain ATCC 19707 / BCRC 17464 / JCM 30415 / NCIMB 11848 / C-107) TaxID=323261 RepID=Q3J9F7_NITOC|nr:DUF423 domain-containing protein [Nitrosococcus oceani]ABA58539.1 Protein of unknown function DUF423 [Nitrosococcus oceani ATCC 19707]EDZ67295.1 conserved hypothetical protein [Nitrosococcus oceani AFC27]GEM19658.1 membrane protein [Nitrosococcus oceani]